MILLLVFLLLRAKYKFLLLRHIAFRTSVSGSLRETIKILKNWRRVVGKLVKVCYHCSTQPNSYSIYLSKHVFSDECMFRINTVVNKQSARFCDAEWPDEHTLAGMIDPDVMIWFSTWREQVISPYYSRMRTLGVVSNKICQLTKRSHASGCCEKTLFFSRAILLCTI